MKHLLSLCLPHMLLSHNIWAYIDALRFYNDFPGSIQRPNVTILAQLDGLIFHHMLSWHDVEDKDRTDKATLASSILTCYNCQRDNFGISVITLTEAGDSSLFPLAVVKVHVKPCKAERWLIMSPAKIPHWGVMIILYVYSVIYILTDQLPRSQKILLLFHRPKRPCINSTWWEPTPSCYKKMSHFLHQIETCVSLCQHM